MSPEQSSEAVRLPVALEELKDVAKEVQDVFRLAREVQEEQRRWREKSEQEEALLDGSHRGRSRTRIDRHV